MTGKWDIHGWENLTANNNPTVVRAREEFLSWLEEVPDSRRTSWDKRLRSDQDHPHFSVRLELFLHHYLTSNRWGLAIEPDVHGSDHKPDFLAEKDTGRVFWEAKLVMDREANAQQDQRLSQLADNLTKRLNRTVMLEPLTKLPSSLPSRRMATEIERQASRLSAEQLSDLDLTFEHQGEEFSIKVLVVSEAPMDRAGEVGVLIFPVRTIELGEQIRSALAGKANRYGDLRAPYVIAISVEAGFPADVREEVAALFGDEVWDIPKSGSVSVTRRREPNGFFTKRLNSQPPHPQVSAVLFYRFRWLEDGHEHKIHAYHNPFAKYPLEPGVFPGIQQLVRKGEKLEWINGIPTES